MTPRLHVFPSSDPEFGAFARAALDGLSDSPTAEELQRVLRSRYPAAIVTTQAELARDGSGPLVWYAYRSAVMGWTVEDRGINWPAWAILDQDRRFLEVSPELGAIAELPGQVMLGHRVEEFSNPDDPTIREDIARLWDEFVERGSVASTLRFNFADGRARELAWWLEADADGPGRHRLSVRELDG